MHQFDRKGLKKILVIDDDPSILLSIEKQLKEEKLEIEFEDDPTRGIKKLGEERYDLVLCDVKMKPISGLEVLERSKSINPNLPVIILTGYVDDQIIGSAKLLGCDDFLVKPVRKSDLINTIRTVLANSGG